MNVLFCCNVLLQIKEIHWSLSSLVCCVSVYQTFLDNAQCSMKQIDNPRNKRGYEIFFTGTKVDLPQDFLHLHEKFLVLVSGYRNFSESGTLLY